MLTGMYDAQMVGCDMSSDEVINRAADRHEEVVEATRLLFKEDDDFENAVREATNTPKRVEYRILKVHDLLQSL